MCGPVKEGSMILNLNTAVTSRQLHNAFQSAISRKETKYYANASNNLGRDKLSSAGFWSFIPTVALNISTKAKVSSRIVPGGNANSIGVL